MECKTRFDDKKRNALIFLSRMLFLFTQKQLDRIFVLFIMII